MTKDMSKRLNALGTYLMGFSRMLHRKKRTDAERLDWLDDNYAALVNDDMGRWAVPDSDIMPVNMANEPMEMNIVHFVKKEEWAMSIRNAIDDAMDRAEE